MRHIVSYFNDSVKNNWDLPAVTNFGKETYTYGQLAENIAKYHIIFKETGIVKEETVRHQIEKTFSGRKAKFLPANLAALKTYLD